MGCWNKFLLLIWKNWKLQLRRPISFIVEVAIPILIIAVFVLIRKYVVKEETEESIYSPYSIESFKNFELVRAYSPDDNKLINEVMTLFQYAKPFPNAEKLEEYLKSPEIGALDNDDIVGIQFDQHMSQIITDCLNINVTLRFSSQGTAWYTGDLYPSYQIGFGTRKTSGGGGPPFYNKFFVPLMYTLTNRFLQKTGNTSRLPKIFLQQFPYPSFSYDVFLKIVDEASLFGYLFMTAFVYAFINMVKSITYEKEKQLKESMKIMGLPTWLHWVAWYCKMMTPFLVITVIMVVLMKWSTVNGAVLEHIDCSLLFIFFFLFVSTIITTSFALSVFFTKANRAASMAGIFWVLSLVPYIIIRSGDYQRSSKGIKYLTSLSITSAMAYGFDIILMYEGTMEGVGWNTLFSSNIQNNLTFGGVLLMMLFDLIFYMLIALYVEAIYPGEFGVPQKWYFFMTSKFWCKKKLDEDEYLLESNSSEFFEEDPTDLTAGIKIRNLGKTFGANVAVKGISLNIFQDQITVLLGHNGAGKTTTMSMLTGMFPPTKGTAVINGYDIRTQIMSVRDSMGLCPQHNVLFDDLTVREHLIFFSRLKGCTGSGVDEEVDKFLKLLNLEDKADDKSTTLSGGMKRKLCVGIALCGNSKIIMLDEPTAGMDPSARRFIWEFLQKQKIGRTILLTTHFMDEADLLGDRIAIMSGGQLQCAGSSFFLKKKYGTGYHLIIDQMPSCNPNNITNVIRKYIPQTEVESNAGTELTYLLPEIHSSKFSHLLAELENESQELGIRSFGISLTDLEEVFMKVGASETGRALPKTRDTYNGCDTSNSTNIHIGISNMQHGSSLYINQSIAMILKKMLSTKRSWGMELLKILLPVVYCVLVLSTADSSSIHDTTYDTRTFELSQYHHPVTLVQSDVDNRQEAYINLLQNMKQTVEVSSNMTERILELTKASPYTVKYKYIVGASFGNDNTAYAWFNNDPYHSVPLSVELLLQQTYKSIMGDKYNINFINYPMPRNMSAEEKVLTTSALGNVNVISLSLAIAYIGTFYILFNVKERMSQAKHLQFVSGINVFIFRFGSFICDFLTYLLPCIALLITFAIVKPIGLNTSYELGVLAFLLFSFGIALLPWIYFFSFLFTIPSTGYSRMFFLSFVTGFPCVIIVRVLEIIKWKYATITKWILRFFPHYDFIEAVNVVVNRQFCDENMKLCAKYPDEKEICERSLCQQGCCGPNVFYEFGSSGIASDIVMLYVIAVVSFLILFLIDFKIVANVIYALLKNVRRPPKFIENVDHDVLDEDNYVKTHSLEHMQSHFALILKDLTKHFWRLTAVNGLNLTVKKSECFGLLGVNGAGKTTTFRMMTGDEMISYGDGWINGYSIKNEMKKVQRYIGYCPQFDALLDNLTARETLKIFSLIRGVPRDETNYMAEKLARDFDFTEHLDKEVMKLSGGNKRKLSTAIALIGDSPIIFLDEPTTGMDPATKRHLWNNLTKIRESGKSIILTSHSMEECEALCTRIAIMVNGNFQCLGSTQHLKSKFAEGYSVTLKIRKPENSRGLEHSDTSNIESFISTNFPNCELREKHQELLTYYIKDKNLTWSKLFGVLETAKGHLDIEDYSVGQASLEQVFLTFTKKQVAEEEVMFKKGCRAWCC
ncbi:hypothetical protein HHI36_018381 [Cryptolaemus montrouzieri]|uniref:ABC transporter domain-containing protein n=1 Tax=Cryptolaemus montrouzieri TaxID=559131 RepID=A0ABD2NZS4_9CUCU